MSLPTERSLILGAGYRMPVDSMAWLFQVKGSLKSPFGITLESRTFVDVHGPRRVVNVMQ